MVAGGKNRDSSVEGSTTTEKPIPMEGAVSGTEGLSSMDATQMYFFSNFNFWQNLTMLINLGQRHFGKHFDNQIILMNLIPILLMN